jgi:hypothetical protein
MKAIPEEIKEEEFSNTQKINDNMLLSVNHKVDKLDNSLRKSCEESEVDGLIKWANNLPDDIAN